MNNFTSSRDNNSVDELWVVEHFPVFTQGLSGKDRHFLLPSKIPVIQSNRGGQITYHGPGQQIIYVLLDLKRRKLGVRKLVRLLERSVVNTLEEYKIPAHLMINFPGVYVNFQKICSLGLRIYKGCSLHGLALNVNMNLSPFLHINPCGFPGMKMTQVHYWNENITSDEIRSSLVKHLLRLLKNPPSHNEKLLS